MDKYLGKMLDNRYEIMEVIGVGGMAVVYKAKCHRLNRLVALKILKDDYAQDADFKRRFHAESQAVAMLSHPNIVAVYDVSRSGNIEYIVMELIDGITLKQYMSKKGRLSWREVLHFSTQIAKALSHAHSRGIVHRDIKPHNIMILRDGSVKVADFGIARFSNKQNTLTQEAFGSVHYISPEQARGSHIDARSDIYSLGVVMYEMLTMRLPYEGDSPVSVAIQHINSIPLTPREVDHSIPEALETITMKAMSASLSKRYPTAEALLHDLEEFRKNPSISFDYDITELMMRDEDEPTRKLTTAPAPKRNAAEDAPVRKRRVSNAADEEVDRARRRNKSLTMATGLAFVLLFIVGMAYLVINFLSSLTGPEGGLPGGNNDDTVIIPNLIGRVYTEVLYDKEHNKEQYPEYVHINIVAGPDAEYSNQFTEGYILDQEPKANRPVKKGTVVTVTLSRGAREFPMPSVVNYEYRQAQNLLIRAEYNLSYHPEIEWETHEDIVKDHVIRTDPPAGENVHEGQVVKLYVSMGPKVTLVVVPEFIGMTFEDAEREADRQDLILSVLNVDSEAPAGEIVWQSVDAGDEIEAKTTIQVHVSIGSEITPPPDDVTPPPDDITPPPDDVTPTPPPQQEVTNEITVTFPSESGSTQLRIRKNGIIIHSSEVNNSVGQRTYEIKGNVGDSVEVYFGDTVVDTHSLQ
ncbi:MAG: Stk1 family PASTA domain-containing Ser/Thr kinase [Oscillospiraceae bacterium]|nr:Stk1 family PASTA domain-containing Ser/Thr kinase [Oscillospiraceae bacterium]